jgi:hypothetical protein
MTFNKAHGPGFLAPGLVAILWVIASFSACQSGTDQGNVQTLTKLKEFQLSFLDTYTAAPGKTWDDSQFQADVAKGEEMFTTAMAGVSDPKRKNALDILRRQFQKDCTFLEKRNKEGKPFYSPAVAQEKKQIIQQNYDLAQKGELFRS